MAITRRDRRILGLVVIGSIIAIVAVLYFAGAFASWAT